MAWISLSFSCLGFSQLLISVGFHLLTNLGSFQPLFLSYFFSATIFILSFLDSDLVIVSQVPKALLFSFFLFFLFFLKFISSLLFRLGNFYYPSFCFTDSLHHLLHSAVHHNSWAFYFSHSIFSVINFSKISTVPLLE